MNSVSSILIIRPSAIGDVVMASPMIKVLREAYPEARLVWLAEPQVRELLEANPALDQVILWSKAQWRQLLRKGRLFTLAREMWRFARALRRERFDLALDAQGLLRSRLLAWLSGARERIGFASREPGRFLMSRIVSKGPESKHMSSEYRHLMTELGLHPGAFAPSIATALKDRQTAQDLNREIGAEFVVFAPFTTRPQKHWFEERWAELARKIDERFGLPVVILGGPGDAEAGRRIRERAAGKISDFCGKTTIGQAAALVERSTLVIGVDTGLTHLGTAFERPTIALFGATCPYLQTASSKTRVLYEKQPCSPCRRNPVCNGEFPCMARHSVESVLAAAESFLIAERVSP